MIDNSYVRMAKAIVLVEHIQNHLFKHEYTSDALDQIEKGKGIPYMEVGCKICEKSMEIIWIEEREYWFR